MMMSPVQEPTGGVRTRRILKFKSSGIYYWLNNDYLRWLNKLDIERLSLTRSTRFVYLRGECEFEFKFEFDFLRCRVSEVLDTRYTMWKNSSRAFGGKVAASNNYEIIEGETNVCIFLNSET